MSVRCAADGTYNRFITFLPHLVFLIIIARFHALSTMLAIIVRLKHLVCCMPLHASVFFSFNVALFTFKDEPNLRLINMAHKSREIPYIPQHKINTACLRYYCMHASLNLMTCELSTQKVRK